MYYSLIRILKKIRRRRQLGAILLLGALAFSITGNTVSFYFLDGNTRVPPLSVGDSFWYSIISITTIGYGDLHANTLGARIGTVVFIIFIGMAAFTTTIGMVLDWMVDIRHKERTGMGKATAREHLIIVNFPNESRIRQIVEEFGSDPRHRGREVVIVTNDMDQLPFQLENVSFIRGSPIEQESYERADIAHASQAIILSANYDDPRSDSLVASAAFVAQRINPNIRIVAEVLDQKHNVLFDLTEGVSLVYTLRVANNLLVQEAQDRGVHVIAHAITSNEIEGTLASTVVESVKQIPNSYVEVAKSLLDHDVNLVGVVREGSVIASLTGKSMNEGDFLVYISKSRFEWSDMAVMITPSHAADRG